MLLPIELDRPLVFFDLETKGENDELEARHLRQVCKFGSRWPDPRRIVQLDLIDPEE